MKKEHIKFGIFAVLALMVVLYVKDILNIFDWLWIMLEPVLLGILIALVLKGPMVFFEKRLLQKLVKKNFKLARALSLTMSFLLVVIFTLFVIFVLLPQVGASLSSLLAQLPAYFESVMVFLQDLFDNLGVPSDTLSNFFVSIQGDLNTLLKQILSLTPDILLYGSKLISIGTNIFLAFTFAMYILFDMEGMGKRYHKVVNAIMPNKKGAYVSRMSNETVTQFGKFINGQVIEAMILGTICFVGMLVMGIPYAPLVSTIITITAIIPIVGALLGTVPAVFIIMVESPMLAIVFVFYIIIVQIVEGNFIYPYIVGNRVELSPFFVMLAIVLGGGFGGVVGIIVFIPLMSVVYKEISIYVNKKDALLKEGKLYKDTDLKEE